MSQLINQVKELQTELLSQLKVIIKLYDIEKEDVGNLLGSTYLLRVSDDELQPSVHVIQKLESFLRIIDQIKQGPKQ